MAQAKVRIGIIGAGAVSDYHHVPGIRLDPRAELVAVADTSADLLEKRKAEWQVSIASTDPIAVATHPDVDAVIIATPNFTHKPIALAAAKAGKHIMCEKPLGLNKGEVREMYEAARDAGVVHMTAFTYRFAPSMQLPAAPARSRAPRHAAALSLAAVPRLARDELGLAAIQGQGRRRRPLRHDDPPPRFRPRPPRPDRPGLRRRRPLRPPHHDPRRQDCPAVGRRRLVVPDRRVRQRRDGRLGGDDTGQGLRPRRIRPRVGRDQRLRRLGRLSPARAEHDPPRQDRLRPRAGGRARGVPQARRQPARPDARASRRRSSATT